MEEYTTEATVCFTEDVSFDDHAAADTSSAFARAVDAIEGALSAQGLTVGDLEINPLTATKRDATWTVEVEVCTRVAMAIDAPDRQTAALRTEDHVADEIATDDDTPPLEDVSVDAVVLKPEVTPP